MLFSLLYMCVLFCELVCLVFFDCSADHPNPPGLPPSSPTRPSSVLVAETFFFEIGLQVYLSLFGGYFGRASDHETAPIEGIFGSAAYHDREVIIVEPELNLFDRHFGAVAVGRKSECFF